MDTILREIAAGLSTPALVAVIGILIYMLGKGADLLVDEAVQLSLKWNVPKMFIGATIVSLGTTFPEAAVSVTAAVAGEPDIALGNAVGSVICDTGLILGLATLISPLPLSPKMVNRQGLIQLAAGVLLVVSCTPFLSASSVFTTGGNLPQFMGFVFLILLGAYMFQSFRWVRGDQANGEPAEDDLKAEDRKAAAILLKLGIAAALVIVSSKLLIPSVLETAVRFSVPESIISATLIAFGTSLPELVTALTAVRKGYGELAVGNVIGADILNVLFVAGAAASVTSGGLLAPEHFFKTLFPAMLLVLAVFRIAVVFSDGTLKRRFGMVLLGVYVFVTYFSYSRII